VNPSTAPARPTHRLRPSTVLLAAAGVVTAAWLVIVVVWHAAPFSLTFDDAFYYFGIARNVAHGHGSTFDGLDLTNGYHPLWMLLASVVYWLGLDGTTAVRVLLGFQVLCYGGALALVAGTAGRAVGDWDRIRAKRSDDGDRAATWCTAIVALALVAVSANPFVVKAIVNGMESGVLVVFDAALLAIGAARRGRFLFVGSGRERWLIGLVLALTLLARTDGVLLVGVLGLWTLAEARRSPRQAVVPMVELFSLPAVTLVGYLVSNRIWFGLWEQISGLTKRAPLTASRVGVLGLVAVMAALVGSWGFKRSREKVRRTRFGRVADFTASTAWFAAFAMLVVAYYQVLQAQQWLWYYCPVVIYLIFVLVLVVADFVEGAVLEARTDASPARAVLTVSAILLLPLVAAGVYEGRQMADPHGYSIAIGDRDAGQWIAAHTPRGTVLASWDAGVIGYYAQRHVINLDGVANSYAYYQAARGGRVGKFLTDRHVGGIVNLGTPLRGQDPSVAAFVRTTLGATAASHLTLARAWPFIYSGSTTGSAGSESGTQHLAVFLYLLNAMPSVAGR
jgi:hypothetical protein